MYQESHKGTYFSLFEPLYGWPMRILTQLHQGLMTGENQRKKPIVGGKSVEKPKRQLEAEEE